MYSPVEGMPEPDWVNIEKEQFNTIRDKDGNSKLDVQEVRDWIFPENYDHVDSEAQHLLVNSDDNKVTHYTSHYPHYTSIK